LWSSTPAIAPPARIHRKNFGPPLLESLELFEREAEKVGIMVAVENMEPFPGEVDRRVPSLLDDPPRSLPLLLSALENALSSRRPTLAKVHRSLVHGEGTRYRWVEPK